MLLVWARGFVFASLNELPLVTSAWGGIRWGVWLRWERKKRAYWGYFRESSAVGRLRARLQARKGKVVHEPAVGKLPIRENEGTLFLFDQIYTDQDLFGPLRAHRGLVRQGLFGMLTPSLERQLDAYPPPVISVHIRRGDFKLGNPITPLDFFSNAIRLARTVTAQDWPVTVFTDAYREEIEDILRLPNVHLAEDKPDILDILLMSKSKMIVLSQSSTFSYWSAFLSDAIIVRPSGDWQENIRPAEVNLRIFEGKVDFSDPASVEKLKKGIGEYPWRN